VTPDGQGGTVELVCGGPAAGGGMVARDGDGRVVFVRHAAPGERVLAAVTERHASWARADAVEVLTASPDRRGAPCPYARPGACGGCDYQHLDPVAQRAAKAERLKDQLRGLAGLDLPVEVRAATAGADGLRTRTRVRMAVDADGRLAMRVHGSHELVPIDDCLLAASGLDVAALAGRRWSPDSELEVVRLAGAPEATLVRHVAGPRGRSTEEVLEGPSVQVTTVGDLAYEVSAGVFWQVHELAPALLVEAVLDGLALSAGDGVLDLYCGAGLFTKAAAVVVGRRGRVVGVDASRAAVADARRNLAGQPWARVVTAKVDARSVRDAPPGLRAAVLDPPRRGVDRGALLALCETGVERVVSVSCEPSTFSRDLRALLDAGFTVESVAGWDLFEQTEHVECVAVLSR